MKKKLLKYIKFFVSLTLILSLVAPSYASLSASDGSTFVTKAEFDSALADFNSRLTTFEAGINSKIDSQVTSYLDRNGIWSKKVQNIVNYSFGNLFMFYPLGVFESPAVDTIQTRNYVLNGTNTTIYFYAPLPIKTSIDNSRTWTIIEEFNKSGMFVCTSAFTAIAGNSGIAWDYDKYKDDDTFHTSTKTKVSWSSTALGKWYADNEDKTSDFDSILNYKNDVNVNNSGFKFCLDNDHPYGTWFSPILNLNIYFYENDELKCVLNPISQVLDSRKYNLDNDAYDSFMGLAIDSAKQPTPYVTQFFVTKGNKLKVKMALEWTGRLADSVGWVISPYDGNTSTTKVTNTYRPEWWTALQMLENGVY